MDTTAEIWATTQTLAMWHAFDEDRALCRSNIRPHSATRFTYAQTDRPHQVPRPHCDRCRKILAERAAAPAPTEQATADRRPDVVIPGALADILSESNLATGADDHDPASKATREALEAGRRGRGRTLVIRPGSVDVLNVISEYADTIIQLADDYTRAEVTAARTWIERAGHARSHYAKTSTPAPEQAAAPADEPAPATRFLVDPWTWIRRPARSEAAKAADERAKRRQELADSRGANAYPLAVSAVRQVVREMPAAGALRVRVVEGSPDATLTRDDLHALAYSGHTTADAVARVRAAVAAHVRHGEREVHVMFPALGMRPALYLPDVLALLNAWEDTQADAEHFDRAARAVDAVEHAEQVEARVDTVEEAEALYAAALVTEADATDGTWRGEWIGEQPADTLFDIEQPEQGALFTETAPAEEETGPVRVRVRFDPAAIERHVAKAAADRVAYRAEMDARKAAERARYGQPEPAVERRVVEGVIVEHAGTGEGSSPRYATHPDVSAARGALSGLAAAHLTDDHDVMEPTDAEQGVHGFMIEPRGGRRVAVYWLVAGQIIRHDDRWHGPALDCLADRLTRRGWRVEDMLASSKCVFAHRPE
ncbi:hypothetical protein [Streptomyces lavendulae]|uniref:hypothetical protein n=1 Tax=Streptomyces lavendulae TaxID=1914 RepID=UPI0031EB3C01